MADLEAVGKIQGDNSINRDYRCRSGWKGQRWCETRRSVGLVLRWFRNQVFHDRNVVHI